MNLYEKKIALIGIGNTGNQVCLLGSKKYPEIFDVVYINTSDADLSMVGQSEYKFKIGDNQLEGSGKNRERTKKFFKQDLVGIIQDSRFTEMVVEKKYVFIISSTAGGTGSGASPIMTAVLKEMFPDVHFIPVFVLPQMAASLGEQENSLEYLNELYRNLVADGITYMAYDNESTADLPGTKALTEVNEAIIEDIRIFSGVDNYPTPFESIDDADMEGIIGTPGRLLVTRITRGLTEKSMEDAKIDDILIRATKNSKHAETNRDKKVARFGFITYLTEATNNLYDGSHQKLQEFIGTPIERFNHNAINDNDENMNFIHFIASGLSPIHDRIVKINDRIDRLKEMLDQSKDLGDAAKLAAEKASRIPRFEKREVKTEVHIGEIFKKF